MFGTIGIALRLVNTASTAYICGKIGWETFKGIRGMQSEVLKAKILRERFVATYKCDYGEEPSEDLIRTALLSYNMVEKPLRYKAEQVTKEITNTVVKTVDSGLERVEKWLGKNKE